MAKGGEENALVEAYVSGTFAQDAICSMGVWSISRLSMTMAGSDVHSVWTEATGWQHQKMPNPPKVRDTKSFEELEELNSLRLRNAQTLKVQVRVAKHDGTGIGRVLVESIIPMEGEDNVFLAEPLPSGVTKQNANTNTYRVRMADIQEVICLDPAVDLDKVAK
jgi:hypothetical protein